MSKMIIGKGYQTQSEDTSQEAERYQFQLWRNLTLPAKAGLIGQWTKGCLGMTLNAIHSRYNEANYHKIKQVFADLMGLPKDIQFNDDPLMLVDPISLTLVIAEIFETLEIRYLVGGSIASTLLGEPRATQDINLVADLKLAQVPGLIQSLQPRFYVSEEAVQEAILLERSFNIIDHQSLGKIDIFILKQHPFNQSEFDRRKARVVRQNPQQSIFLPTPEDLILQKLLWYRQSFNSQKQWRDVLGVVKLQGNSLDLAYLWEWGTKLNLVELLQQIWQESGQ